MGHRDIATTQRYADYMPGAGEADLITRAFTKCVVSVWCNGVSGSRSRADRHNKAVSRWWIEVDLVAQRFHFEGTQTGEFQGLPPTHRKVSFDGLELNRFVDGRVAEQWFQMDALSLLQQLGVMVVPGLRRSAQSPVLGDVSEAGSGTVKFARLGLCQLSGDDPIGRWVSAVRTMAAIFNLNHPPHIVHWHFIYLSLSNVIVIAVMLVVFALAILLPFPKHRVDPGPS